MRKAGKSNFDQAVIALVKAMREEKKLSQDDLALYLDVTAAGATSPSPSDNSRFCAGYGDSAAGD
jgi:hypothetical protein